MAAFKSVLLRLVYSCSRYSEEYGDGSFWMAQKPPFATGNFGSSAVSVSVFDGFRFLSADPSGSSRPIPAPEPQ